MIKVVKESPDLGGPPYEKCCICRQPAPYWYAPKDVAVCKKCADKVEDSDVPSKEEWWAQGD